MSGETATADRAAVVEVVAGRAAARALGRPGCARRRGRAKRCNFSVQVRAPGHRSGARLPRLSSEYLQLHLPCKALVQREQARSEFSETSRRSARRRRLRRGWHLLLSNHCSRLLAAGLIRSTAQQLPRRRRRRVALGPHAVSLALASLLALAHSTRPPLHPHSSADPAACSARTSMILGRPPRPLHSTAQRASASLARRPRPRRPRQRQHEPRTALACACRPPRRARMRPCSLGRHRSTSCGSARPRAVQVESFAEAQPFTSPARARAELAIPPEALCMSKHV